jgi:hypothetical protein
MDILGTIPPFVLGDGKTMKNLSQYKVLNHELLNTEEEC